VRRCPARRYNKAAINIIGRRDVTVIVPRSHRRVLSLDYAGGWLYSGPWGRCVPMSFRVDGRPRLIHRRVPLGAGRCPTRRSR
jgi:hypothetical protein